MRDLGSLEARLATLEAQVGALVRTRLPGWELDTGTARRAVNATYAAPIISNPPTDAEVQSIGDALEAATQTIKALKDDLHKAKII